MYDLEFAVEVIRILLARIIDYLDWILLTLVWISDSFIFYQKMVNSTKSLSVSEIFHVGSGTDIYILIRDIKYKREFALAIRGVLF